MEMKSTLQVEEGVQGPSLGAKAAALVADDAKAPPTRPRESLPQHLPLPAPTCPCLPLPAPACPPPPRRQALPQIGTKLGPAVPGRARSWCG